MTKNSPHFKKFTLTLWVAWVTNMRYGNCKDDSDGGGDDDDNDDDVDDNDDEDDYSCNSVNFQARTSKFCMEVCLDDTCNTMMKKITIIMMMIMIIAVTQSISKLGLPDFAWTYNIVSRSYL